MDGVIGVIRETMMEQKVARLSVIAPAVIAETASVAVVVGLFAWQLQAER